MTRVAKVLVIGVSIALAVVVVGGCSGNGAPQGESDASPGSSSAAPTGGSVQSNIAGKVTTGDQAVVSSSDSSSPTPAVPNDGMVRSNTGGKVTIDVEWLGLDNGVLNFRVAMNTHSVELDGYDLMNLSVLRDDMGNEYSPESWDSRPGGHHRKGTLTFPLPDSLIQRETEYMEMIIRDVAGIESRTLMWLME